MSEKITLGSLFIKSRFPILDEINCISEETQFNRIGNRIIRLVLDKEKIKPYAAFKIKDYGKNCIVGRMDFVESLLRRGVRGIRVEEVTES